MSEDEHPGQGQMVITRRRVLHTHSATTDKSIDFGRPTDKRTFHQLQTLAQEKTDELLERFKEISTIDENTLTQIANFANAEFSFKNQGTGIGTIPELLENYRALPKKDLSDRLDCKLATVMVGLIAQNIANRNGQRVGVLIAARGKNLIAHPTLIVNASGNSFIVDFYSERDSGNSNFHLRPLSEEGRVGISTGRIASVKLDADGLNKLDQVFLRD